MDCWDVCGLPWPWIRAKVHSESFTFSFNLKTLLLRLQYKNITKLRMHRYVGCWGFPVELWTQLVFNERHKFKTVHWQQSKKFYEAIKFVSKVCKLQPRLFSPQHIRKFPHRCFPKPPPLVYFLHQFSTGIRSWASCRCFYAHLRRCN